MTQVVVMFVLGIPGVGKSSLCKSIKKYLGSDNDSDEIAFHSVSSDKIRGKLMKKLLKKKNKYDLF